MIDECCLCQLSMSPAFRTKRVFNQKPGSQFPPCRGVVEALGILIALIPVVLLFLQLLMDRAVGSFREVGATCVPAGLQRLVWHL